MDTRKSIALAAAVWMSILGGCASVADRSAVGAQPAIADTHPGAEQPSSPVTWSEVQALLAPPPGTRIAYGALPDQFGELRLPPGPGPHPVAVLIHGGCWLQEFDYVYFRHLAAAVTKLGIATWTIEYRRVAGAGGWPMTFLDVADAIDHLRNLGDIYPLDLQRVVAIGHSAGGHLALWSATRDRLTPESELYRPFPLAIHGVIGLAPIADLSAYRVGPTQSCHGAVDSLMGGPPEEHPDRYADASPSARLPIGAPMVLVSGAQDTIVTTRGVRAFADAAIAAGDRARLERIDGAGHFEPSVPFAAAWAAVQEALRRLVDPNSSR